MRFFVFFVLFTFTTLIIQWITADGEVKLENLVVKTGIAGLIAAGVFTLLANRIKKKKRGPE